MTTSSNYRTFGVVLIGICGLAAASAGAQQSLIVDSSGNVGIGTSVPAATVNVSKDGANVLVQNTEAAVGDRSLFQLENNGKPIFRLWDKDKDVIWDFKNGATFFITRVNSGGTEFKLTSVGDLTVRGNVFTGSSREIKTNINDVDSQSILDKVMDLPISEWSYKTRKNVRHIGPMAEDFSAKFGFGQDDKSIASIDASGVALAAIQALKTEKDLDVKNLVEIQEKKISDLRVEVSELKNLILKLVGANEMSMQLQ